MPEDLTEADVAYTPLPYEQLLNARDLADIELVVIHCTELPDLATAREFAERIHHQESVTGNSGHYYIDRDGGIYQYVALDRVAHHVAGNNANSVGIELVNQGRYPDSHSSDHQDMTQPYADVQIEALLALLDHLKRQLPKLRQIAGHEDLDTRLIPAEDDPRRIVRRKTDPGPLFPWDRVLTHSKLVRIPAPVTGP